MVKNGNLTLLLTSPGLDWHFTLLLTSSGQEWQLADLPADLLPNPPNATWFYIMGCIGQPFWILQEKVGISFISE